MSAPHVALLICSNIIGGHEFQAAALARSLVRHLHLTVFVNQADHVQMFEAPGIAVNVQEQMLLRPGILPKQFLHGWLGRKQLRAAMTGFDHVIVSAGTVEAGVAAGTALRGLLPMTLYLPSFFDRVPLWGRKGHLYNGLLGLCCRLFDRVLTINRIQAHVIKAYTGVDTAIIGNQVREVGPAARGPARWVFIGRLDHPKRVGEMLSWLDFHDNPINELLIIGDGPLMDSLQKQAQHLRHLHCEFTGWLTAQAQDAILRRDDILVLNSLLEGEPLAIREARFRGMRVIARDITGVRGITKPSDRYSTLEELQQRIRNLESHNLARQMDSSQPSAGKREAQVERFVEQIVRRANT